MNEEEKAIEFLKNKTTNYSLSEEELHYYLILYYLIINLQKENNQLKDKQKHFEKYLKDIIDAYKEIDREFILSNKKREIKTYKEMLQKYREIIGSDK